MQIPRVALEIKYLEEDTKAESEKEAKMNKKLEENEEAKQLVNSVGNLNIDGNRENVFQDVQKLRTKLAEFKYFEDDLFPDFEDF